MTTLSPEFVSATLHLLRWARDKYESSKDPEEKRISRIIFIQILHRLCREIDPAVVDEALLAPLNDLILSLVCLNHGVVDPSLRPLKPKHRPSDPRWAIFRGSAAAASEWLIRQGATASEADVWVAKRLSKDGYQKPGKSADRSITAATIKGWRKAAREARPDELIGTEFEDLMQDRDPKVREFLPQLSPIYEVLFRYGAEEKLENVTDRGMMQAVTIIDLIRPYFPPPESPEK